MAKILYLPKRVRTDEELKVLHLQSYLRSNILKLADLRCKLVKLQEDVRRLTEPRLQLVQNADSNKPTNKKPK